MPTRSERIRQSRVNVDDEFYTIYQDIADELPNYKKYLKGKRIICPCDWDESFKEEIIYDDGDYVSGDNLFASGGNIKNINIKANQKKFEKDFDLIKCNFIKFLVSHAEAYQIKSISACGYNPKTEEGIKFQDIDYSKYDIVITNPPFSLFSEFIDVMFKNDMNFIVIGPQNAINDKDIFTHLKNNEMWLGYHYHLTGLVRPDGTILPKNDNLVRCCGWYSNIDVSYRHDKLILTEKYEDNKYPKYFNFDGIDINETKNIPYDFEGYMGVPLTFMQKYNPEQFEIIDLGSLIEKNMQHIAHKEQNVINYEKNGTIIWSTTYTVNERKIGNGLRISKDGLPGESPWGRIIIKNKEVYHDED